MNKAREKFETFTKKPFPKNTSTNETVSDLFMELVEYDSYVAGLIDQVLSGRKVEGLKYDQNLEEQLRKCLDLKDLDEISSNAVSEEIEYLLEIKEIIDELKH